MRLAGLEVRQRRDVISVSSVRRLTTTQQRHVGLMRSCFYLFIRAWSTEELSLPLLSSPCTTPGQASGQSSVVALTRLLRSTEHLSLSSRVQTTAGKVFLISAGVMSGLVINAEYKLQAYEAAQRYQFNYARRRAKYELTKEGKIATEPEIKQ